MVFDWLVRIEQIDPMFDVALARLSRRIKHIRKFTTKGFNTITKRIRRIIFENLIYFQITLFLSLWYFYYI